jgi:hypothetical protein
MEYFCCGSGISKVFKMVCVISEQAFNGLPKENDQKLFSQILILFVLFFQVTSKKDLLSSGEESPKPSFQDKDFIIDCLCWHNEYRARHGAPALSASSEVSFD